MKLNIRKSRLFAATGFLCGLLGGVVFAGSDDCSVCGKPIEKKVYFWQDEVAGEKKKVCEQCSELTECYLCGLPVKNIGRELSDGRILCTRDTRSVVLDDEEALKICEHVKDALDRQFSRFINFPSTNVNVRMVDRVDLQDLFRSAGEDHSCPEVWGYASGITNHARVSYRIRILTGLPRSALKATCAHEYAHLWLIANLSQKRSRHLEPDAVEGFCELIAYLLMDAQNESAQKQVILKNRYTRGQVKLFIEAEKRFGFNEVIDWILQGTDDALIEDKLDRIREQRSGTVAAGNSPEIDSKETEAAVRVVPVVPTNPPAPDKLLLQGIVWSRSNPTAVINGRTFRSNDVRSVRLGATNFTVRCLEIRPDAVVIQVDGSAQRQKLTLD